jgi:hypothetical protein
MTTDPPTMSSGVSNLFAGMCLTADAVANPGWPAAHAPRLATRCRCRNVRSIVADRRMEQSLGQSRFAVCLIDIEVVKVHTVMRLLYFASTSPRLQY